jgi:hypothetical protein
MRSVQWLPFVLVLAACEQTTIIEGHISIDPAATPTTSAPILVVVDGSPDASLTWDPHGLPGEADSDAFTPGRSDYDYRWEQYGKPPHALFIAAFVDLDHDGMLGVDEPFGTFDANPILDAPWGNTAPASHADIVIGP